MIRVASLNACCINIASLILMLWRKLLADPRKCLSLLKLACIPESDTLDCGLAQEFMYEEEKEKS